MGSQILLYKDWIKKKKLQVNHLFYNTVTLNCFMTCQLQGFQVVMAVNTHSNRPTSSLTLKHTNRWPLRLLGCHDWRTNYLDWCQLEDECQQFRSCNLPSWCFLFCFVFITFFYHFRALQLGNNSCSVKFQGNDSYLACLDQVKF